MTEAVKLVNPTVGDMIEYLKTMPENVPFLMADADTNWRIDVIHVELDEHGLWLSGQYHEMTYNLHGMTSTLDNL